MLARGGQRTTLIGRAPHVAAIARDGLQLEMGGRVEVVRIDATTEIAAASAADLVLVCVKSTDTADVAQALASQLAPGVVVLSLQNGVDNAETLARAINRTVVPAVVYVATALTAPGRVTHYGEGRLVIGPRKADAADPAVAATLPRLVDLFAHASVPVRISDDVMGELWSKLLINCAYNAISALAQAPYGQFARVAAVRDLQQAIVHEVIAVAAADGVELDLERSTAAMARIAVTMGQQRSSTAQDLARGRRSEIDHLNGFISRRGRQHGIATPVNDTLTTLVKLVEATARP
jgi:2-dehydropantoate 2-reductase